MGYSFLQFLNYFEKTTLLFMAPAAPFSPPRFTNLMTKQVRSSLTISDQNTNSCSWSIQLQCSQPVGSLSYISHIRALHLSWLYKLYIVDVPPMVMTTIKTNYSGSLKLWSPSSRGFLFLIREERWTRLNVIRGERRRDLVSKNTPPGPKVNYD